ncbi:MAG: hypothetical protein OEY33_07140, partial [Bdellovibrionales bacterium]|nr:hypothetical protein [Bdellovibrionales bacterium]
MFKFLLLLVISLNLFAQENESTKWSIFKRDMSKLDVDLYVAPLKFQTLYNLRDITYGFNITNFKKSKEGLKYEILLGY